jgi:uncharacterized membrane protein
MWQWLRHRFIAGLFVTVPLVVSVVAIVWVFRWVDGLTRGLGEQVLGPPGPDQPVPGIVVSALGIVATAAIVLAAGALATNVIGRRLVDRTEQLLLHVPLFRTVYAPVRQLLNAFAPESEVGFKRMVLVDDPPRGFVLGFLTKEFVVDRGQGPEQLLAVYVPTNHLYLGDVRVCHPDQVMFPELTVEDGVRVFLTGGMGLPDRLQASHAGHGTLPAKREGESET